METEKAISIHFTDLQDTPNDLTYYNNHIVVVGDDKSLKFSRCIEVDNIVNNADTKLKGQLEVLGKCNLVNDTYASMIHSQAFSSDVISCYGDMRISGSTLAETIKSKSLETENVKVSQTLTSQIIESSQLKSVSMETDNLIIHKDLNLPVEVNIESLNVKGLKVSETSYFNKTLSTEHTCVSLNSSSGLITDLTSVNSTIVDLKATIVDAEQVSSKSFYHKTSDIDGSADVPEIKELDGGYFQRMIHSSKYVWYGMLKSSSRSIKMKINTQTAKVLSTIIPRVSFHIYDLRGLDLNPSFKYDTQIFLNQNDDSSFFVNLNFSDNVPLISKFIFSVVLEKV